MRPRRLGPEPGRWACAGLGLVLALTVPGPAGGETLHRVDRIVAVVDDDPILASDIERVLALGLAGPRPGESPEATQRRVLDQLVEQRLRYHEVERYRFSEVPAAAVDEQVARLATELGGEAELATRLSELGLDAVDLRQLLRRQLEVFLYVDELLGARVFVGLEEIQRYYAQELVPTLRERGESIPDLDDVREQIREVLRQQRLNEELETWTEGLRAEADVLIYLDSEDRPLPPRVEVPPP